MRSLPRPLALAFLLLLGACSDDGGGSSESPATQCREYIDRACSLADRCNQQEKNACLNESNAGVRCDRAVRVTSDYEACLAAMNSATCPADPSQLTLPSVCRGVVQINDSGSAGSGGGPGSSEVVAKCEQFKTLLCDFADECKLQDRTACLADASASLPCGSVSQIGVTYDQCIADFKALSCPPSADQFQAPLSCNSVFLQ